MSNTRIKTASVQPRRFALPVLVLLAAVLAGCSEQAPVDPEKTATLIQPEARVALNMDKPAEEETTDAGGPPDGEAIYKKVCAACHASGVAGAPKEGDAGAWSERIAQGLDAMVDSAIAGKGAMPPRGGNPNLSDEEMRHAVVYLLNTAGGEFSAE
ncbi:MAG: cytochrome c5 family protein [Azoarcus sp.]|nr:cytochrome c5 family protein [Azoarcus sp.]